MDKSKVAHILAHPVVEVVVVVVLL